MSQNEFIPQIKTDNQMNKPKSGKRKVLSIIAIIMLLTPIIIVVSALMMYPAHSIDVGKTYSLANISEINIDTFSTNVVVKTVDGDQVKTRLYGNYRQNPKMYARGYIVDPNNPAPSLSGTIAGGTLYLTMLNEPAENTHLFTQYIKSFNKMTVEVSIPSSYKNNLTFSQKKDDTQGDINGEKQAMKEAEDMSGMGDLSVSNINLDKLSIKKESGNINLDSITAKNIQMSSAAASVTLNDCSADLTISTMGDITVNSKTFNNNYTLNTAVIPDEAYKFLSGTGNIKVVLPEDSNFKLNANTVKGTISNEFTLDGRSEQTPKKLIGTKGDTNNQIILNTGSGNINIGYK